jgi:hypothetical protein
MGTTPGQPLNIQSRKMICLIGFTEYRNAVSGNKGTMCSRFSWSFSLSISRIAYNDVYGSYSPAFISSKIRRTSAFNSRYDGAVRFS